MPSCVSGLALPAGLLVIGTPDYTRVGDRLTSQNRQGKENEALSRDRLNFRIKISVQWGVSKPCHIAKG